MHASTHLLQRTWLVVSTSSDLHHLCKVMTNVKTVTLHRHLPTHRDLAISLKSYLLANYLHSQFHLWTILQSMYLNQQRGSGHLLATGLGAGPRGNQPQYRKSTNYFKLAKKASAMSTTESKMGKFSAACFTRYFTVGVLTAINLLNYMDRYTLAGKSPSLGPWRLRMTHVTWHHLPAHVWFPYLMSSADVRILILFMRDGVRYKLLIL